LGKRAYCDRHFAAVNKANTHAWRAGFVELLGLGLFSGLMIVLGEMIGTPDPTTRGVVGLMLAIVPSALWLLYFRATDRFEPEPKHHIALVFFVALALYEILGHYVIENWFRLPEWASINPIASLLGHLLVVGMVFQAVQYIAVRTIYGSEEFDERMDGIVYGTVAGLGLALMLNLRYVIGNQGVAIAPGVVTTVTNALAQASFGGLMGYVMGVAKFEHKPALWVPLGFAIVALLNGFFVWLMHEVSIAGLSVEYLRSLALGLAVAVSAFLLLQVLMRRALRLAL
jgi:RsiW-degrading membrane proteinase PrsW (M82 family)